MLRAQTHPRAPARATCGLAMSILPGPEGKKSLFLSSEFLSSSRWRALAAVLTPQAARRAPGSEAGWFCEAPAQVAVRRRFSL